MAKATLTIAIGGEYQGRDAIRKAEAELKSLRETARQIGGGTSDLMKFGDAFVDIGTNMDATGQKMADIGMKATKLAAPLAALGAAAVKMAADYENSVAKVYTIMDKGVMSTDQMSKSILDLSTATGRSATELSDATYQALSASVATEKVAGFVENAVKLSKAGFTETATAVDTLTTVINAYGYAAEDAQMISDKLVQTQNKGKTTVDEMAQSLGNVIPTAAAYNVNLDNLCSSYVVMTKQGINTANATTAINGMLTELADTGSNVAKVLQEKTGKSFGQLMADGMDLGQVIQILSESVDGDSEAFANLWGNVRASKGALAIANAGAAEFSETMGDMADSTGLCDKALEDLETPAAKAGKALNAMKNTGIQLGEEIIGAAVPSLEKLSDMAQDLYKWFGSLDEGTKQNIVRFGALAVAAGPVITVFGKLYSGVGSLITKLGTGMQSIGSFAAAMKNAETNMAAAGATSVSLGTKMKAAAEQTGVLTKATSLLKGSLAMIGIGAAVAAVGLIVEKYNEWREHTEKVEKATRGMETAIGEAKAAYDAYTPSVDGATKALDRNATSANDALESQAALADRMGETWKDVGTNAAMVDRYAQTIAELGSKGDLTKEELVRLQNAVDAFNQLTGSSVEITNQVTGELNTSREAILGVAEAYKEEAKAAAARELLIDVNKQIYQDEMALKQAKDSLAAAEAEYQDALAHYPDQAWTYGQAVTEAKNKVSEMERALNSAVKSEQDLVDVIAESPTHFKTFDDALASCGTSIEGLGDVTDEQLTIMQERFDGTLQSIYDACVEQGVNIPDGLSQGIERTSSNPVESTGKMLDSLIEKARSKLESHSPSMVMHRLGADIDTGLGNGISGGASGPWTAMSNLAQSMVNAISGLPRDAAITGSNAAVSFSDGVGSQSAYWSGLDLAASARDGMGSVGTYTTGWNFAVGFGDGMYGPDIWGAAYDIGMSALKAIKNALGISSPSKEAMKMGAFFGEGVVIGMRGTEDSIEDEAKRMSGLMGLSPELPTAYAGGVYGSPYGGGNMNKVEMSVNVYVSASNASEGREVGTSLADSLYEELSRKMGSDLWPVSYSAA